MTHQFNSSNDFDLESFFLSTVSKAQDGRFIVRLPLIDSLDKLGESEALALKRFKKKLEHSLTHKIDLKNKLDHIKKIEINNYQIR